MGRPAPRPARSAGEQWGYDGVELACWGDHFDVDQAPFEDAIAGKNGLLAKHGLTCHAISNHLVGQAVCDRIDERHQSCLPRVWGDGEPEGVRQRAADELADTAGRGRVRGESGGLHRFQDLAPVAMFPPVPPEMIEEGYADFAERWNPILDVFDDGGVRFAQEVHPTEIAYDFWTTGRALEAVETARVRAELRPQPLRLAGPGPGGVPAPPDRIYHVDCKERERLTAATAGRLAPDLGRPAPGLGLRSAGRGEVAWEDVFRMLNSIGYDGPISVEWEDAGMDRLAGRRRRWPTCGISISSHRSPPLTRPSAARSPDPAAGPPVRAYHGR